MVRVPSPKRPWLILIQAFRGGRGGVVSIRRRILGGGAPLCSLRIVEKDDGVENFVVIKRWKKVCLEIADRNKNHHQHNHFSWNSSTTSNPIESGPCRIIHLAMGYLI